MENYLSIGKMAATFNMDVQLLRHYDKIGLLVPAVRHEDSKRRYYYIDQVYRLATIRYLRKLGYSLKKIKQFMEARGVAYTVDTLRQQSEILHKQLDELLTIDRIIQKKLAFVQEETKNLDMAAIGVKSFPERVFVLIGPESILFTHDLFYFYPTVGFYENNKKWFGAYLFEKQANVDLDDEKYAPQLSRIPAGRYLYGYHHGPYQSISESIERLRKAGSPRRLAPLVVTINIVDQFVESHPENYVTELQFLIEQE